MCSIVQDTLLGVILSIIFFNGCIMSFYIGNQSNNLSHLFLTGNFQNRSALLYALGNSEDYRKLSWLGLLHNTREKPPHTIPATIQLSCPVFF